MPPLIKEIILCAFFIFTASVCEAQDGISDFRRATYTPLIGPLVPLFDGIELADGQSLSFQSESMLRTGVRLEPYSPQSRWAIGGDLTVASQRFLLTYQDREYSFNQFVAGGTIFVRWKSVDIFKRNHLAIRTGFNLNYTPLRALRLNTANGNSRLTYAFEGLPGFGTNFMFGVEVIKDRFNYKSSFSSLGRIGIDVYLPFLSSSRFSTEEIENTDLSHLELSNFTRAYIGLNYAHSLDGRRNNTFKNDGITKKYRNGLDEAGYSNNALLQPFPHFEYAERDFHGAFYMRGVIQGRVDSIITNSSDEYLNMSGGLGVRFGYSLHWGNHSLNELNDGFGRHRFSFDVFGTAGIEYFPSTFESALAYYWTNQWRYILGGGVRIIPFKGIGIFAGGEWDNRLREQIVGSPFNNVTSIRPDNYFRVFVGLEYGSLISLRVNLRVGEFNLFQFSAGNLSLINFEIGIGI